METEKNTTSDDNINELCAACRNKRYTSHSDRDNIPMAYTRVLCDSNIPRVFFMVMLLFGFNDIANLVPVRPRPSRRAHTHTHTRAT